jgi:hypothetical protein
MMDIHVDNRVEKRLDAVDKRLDSIEVLVQEVLESGQQMDEQLNEKLDILQDDFETQRRMLKSLKKSLRCQLTRRRILDWVLSIMCIVILFYFYSVVHALH